MPSAFLHDVIAAFPAGITLPPSLFAWLPPTPFLMDALVFYLKNNVKLFSFILLFLDHKHWNDFKQPWQSHLPF